MRQLSRVAGLRTLQGVVLRHPMFRDDAEVIRQAGGTSHAHGSEIAASPIPLRLSPA